MIIARVNDYEIKHEEYQYELKHVLNKMKLKTPNMTARKRALDQLIDGYLLLNSAKQSEIRATEEEIENKLLDFKLNYESESEFDKMLKQRGLSLQQIRERLTDEVLITKYVETNFPESCDISDEQLLQIYQENKQSFKTQEMVRAFHILIKGQDDSSLEEAIKLKKQINSEEDFYQAAKECSDCPSSIKKGDLGYFKRGEMIKEFEDVAFSLKEKEISEPVKTRFGYHIIMVIDKQKGTLANFSKVKDALKKRLQKIESELKLIKHLKRLRADASIMINHKNL